MGLSYPLCYQIQTLTGSSCLLTLEDSTQSVSLSISLCLSLSLTLPLFLFLPPSLPLFLPLFIPPSLLLFSIILHHVQLLSGFQFAP